MADNDNGPHDFFTNLEADSQGKRDTDLGGMDRETAKEYVLAFITTLKETQHARENAEQEKILWKGRVELARSKNEELLATQAEMKVNEIDAKLSQLIGEEQELQRLRAKHELTLDPDALLAQLEMLTGKPDTTTKKIRETEADMELEELKRKMQEEGP
jgi:hypothetical protein